MGLSERSSVLWGVALKRKGVLRHSSFHPGDEQFCSALGSHHGVRLHRGQEVMMPIDPGLGFLEERAGRTFLFTG